MQTDLNLLLALDYFLQEESVSAAAKRMNLSVAAASRILSQLRLAFHDPLLVRAGRGLVPTPRALQLRDEVHSLVSDARDLFLRKRVGHLAALHRTFNIRTDESISSSVAGRLVSRLREKAPMAKIRFLQRTDRDAGLLREGAIDIDIGAGTPDAPEIKSQLLMRDTLVGVARTGHPITQGRVTAQKYSRFLHVNVSRQGVFSTAIDTELEKLGLTREVVMTLPGFFGAIALVAESEMLAVVPEYLLRFSPPLLLIESFRVPVPLEAVKIVQSWHPRFDQDEAHALLRNIIRDVFQHDAS